MECKIIIDSVNKKFRRDYKKNEGILARLLSFLNENDKIEFNALKNISFKVNEGEIFGVIGKNGSGKSTLLRVIAGIYKPDSGSIKTRGEIVYLTGFDHGLQRKLTMRENIYLLGILRGLSKKEINEKFDEIVDFSGLREYLDAKVYQFSTGMINRLSFSITFFCIVHKNPGIILIDEVFGVGADIDFREKSLKKMEELIKKGSSVILASHDLELIKKYCDKVIWLDNGYIVKIGKGEEIINHYMKSENSMINI